jgi:hypothetical protein
MRYEIPSTGPFRITHGTARFLGFVAALAVSAAVILALIGAAALLLLYVVIR